LNETPQLIECKQIKNSSWPTTTVIKTNKDPPVNDFQATPAPRPTPPNNF
jgi:hypothetical protein